MDVDGTLLAPGNVLAPAAARALRAAQRAGITVTLATGRMYRSAAQWAARLGLSGPLIAYNGGLIVDYPAGRVLRHRPVPLRAARAVADLCRARGWFLQAYFDDRLFVPAAGPRADAYARTAGVTYEVDPGRVYHPTRPPTKLLVIEDPAAMPAIAAELAARGGGALHLATSFPHYLEIQARGVSKAAALRWLARRLGVPRTAVLAAGDGENDLEMVRYAGTGVAVANAVDAVKAVAALVTRRPYGEGVAEAVRACLRWAGARPGRASPGRPPAGR